MSRKQISFYFGTMIGNLCFKRQYMSRKQISIYFGTLIETCVFKARCVHDMYILWIK